MQYVIADFSHELQSLGFRLEYRCKPVCVQIGWSRRVM
jgi:hypothetical protein